MGDAGSDYERLLALHHAMRLRRSMRNEELAGPPLPTAPAGYPEREADQAMLVASLETIGSAADEVAATFYVLLFDGRPYLRGMFPADLSTATDRLFAALIGLVEGLAEPDGLATSLAQLGRDHRKYGVRPSHYDAVREALLGALRAHAGPAWHEGYERAWRRAYDHAAQVMRAAEAGSTDPPYWQGTVTGHERRYTDIAVLRLRTDHPYRYTAGQYATLEVPTLPRLWRPYSMATAPGEALEFHVRAKAGGKLSEHLVHRTHVGDQLRLGPPMGGAVLGPDGTGALLCVAGGTGLAPCRAVVEQSLRDHPDRPVHLIFGAHRAAELYDLPALIDLAGRYRNFTLAPATTRQPNFPGLRGRLPDLLAAAGPHPGDDVYVCGPPGLVLALDRVLHRLGIPADHVHHDPVPN